MSSIAVCILFFEKLEQTKECIESFLFSGLPIYVVSNGSSEKSVTSLRTCFSAQAQVHIHTLPENVGVAAGRNYLWRHAPEEWLFFVDNDITIQPGEWRPIADQYIKHYGATAHAFVPDLYNIHTGNLRSALRLSLQEKTITPVTSAEMPGNMFPGGAVLMRRSLLQSLGGYNESFFVGYEDYEFAARAMKSGVDLNIVRMPEILLVHEHEVARTDTDAAAALERYSGEHTKNSADLFEELYSIELKKGGLGWVNQRRDYFLGNEKSQECPTDLAPREAEFFLSAQCNLPCGSYRKKPANATGIPDMPLALASDVIERYPGINLVRLGGFGEPTLHPEFLDIVDLLSAKGKKVVIRTNGTKPEVIQNISAPNCTVSIELYGAGPESFLARTGADLFDKVVEAYSLARERAIPVGFSWVQKRSSLHELAEILRFCDSLQPDFLHIHNYLALEETDVRERAEILRSDDRECVETVLETIRSSSYVIPPVFLDARNASCTCPSYYTTLKIDGEGNVSCCQGPVSPSSCFGNFYRDADPFTSPVLQRLRKRVAHGCAPHAACLYCFRRTEISAVYPLPTREDLQMVRASGLFDEAWYREQYLLGRPEKFSPLEHFLQFGPKKNYWPNPAFSPREYLRNHPQAFLEGVNPLVHYIRSGNSPSEK